MPQGKIWGRNASFGRLWFDEVRSTVVTRAEPRLQRILHPLQHRVMSIRENARCQVGASFPPPLGDWRPGADASSSPFSLRDSPTHLGPVPLML